MISVLVFWVRQKSRWQNSKQKRQNRENFDLVFDLELYGFYGTIYITFHTRIFSSLICDEGDTAGQNGNRSLRSKILDYNPWAGQKPILEFSGAGQNPCAGQKPVRKLVRRSISRKKPVCRLNTRESSCAEHRPKLHHLLKSLKAFRMRQRNVECSQHIASHGDFPVELTLGILVPRFLDPVDRLGSIVLSWSKWIC